jgi:DNA polymerase III delta prime subunit
MGYDLSTLKTTRKDDPPRLLIYGPPGLGKTTLAAEFPAPVILDIEAGAPSGVDIASFGEIESYDQVLDALKALYTGEHAYRTLIIDTLDRLEPLVWAKACEANSWPSIEAPGYGKGYVAADEFWRKLLAGCNALRAKRGMTVVLIAHSAIERFDDPTNAPYSRYDIRLHKRANALVQDEVDAILFLNQDITVQSEDAGFNKQVRRAEGGGSRWIHCEGRPAFTAKNRFGMPWRLKFDAGRGYAQLAPYLPGQPGDAKKEAA